MIYTRIIAHGNSCELMPPRIVEKTRYLTERARWILAKRFERRKDGKKLSNRSVL